MKDKNIINHPIKSNDLLLIKEDKIINIGKNGVVKFELNIADIDSCSYNQTIAFVLANSKIHKLTLRLTALEIIILIICLCVGVVPAILFIIVWYLSRKDSFNKFYEEIDKKIKDKKTN